MIRFHFPRQTDDKINRALDAVSAAFDVLDALPLVEHVLVGPVAIGTTDTRVYHGLGRAPRGYWLIKSPADVRVFDGATPETIDPKNFVTLRLSSAQTVTLIVT